jgi:hypothetical protein
MCSDEKKLYRISSMSQTAKESASFQRYVSSKFLSEKKKRRPRSLSKRDQQPDRAKGATIEPKKSKKSKSAASVNQELDGDKSSRIQQEIPFTTYKASPDGVHSPLVELAGAAALDSQEKRRLKERKRAERLQRAKDGGKGTVAKLSKSCSGRDESVVEKDRPTLADKAPSQWVEVCEMARQGNIARLREIIDEGDGKEMLKQRDGSNMNALDHACAAGQVEIMRELILICGVDVNCANDVDGYTALHHACASGSLQAVTFLLLVANAEENRRGFDGFTPFDLATTKELRKFLLSRRQMSNRKVQGRSASVSNLSSAISEALLSSPTAAPTPPSAAIALFSRVPPPPSSVVKDAAVSSPSVLTSVASTGRSATSNKRSSAPDLSASTSRAVLVEGSMMERTHDDSSSSSSEEESDTESEEFEYVVPAAKPKLELKKSGSLTAGEASDSSRASNWKNKIMGVLSPNRARSGSEISDTTPAARKEGKAAASTTATPPAAVVETSRGSSEEDDNDSSPSGRKMPSKRFTESMAL